MPLTKKEKNSKPKKVVIEVPLAGRPKAEQFGLHASLMPARGRAKAGPKAGRLWTLADPPPPALGRAKAGRFGHPAGLHAA